MPASSGFSSDRNDLMLIAITDQHGRPMPNAVAGICKSPAPHSDIGLVANSMGVISIDIPADGVYRFVISWQGQLYTATRQIDKRDTQISIKAWQLQ